MTENGTICRETQGAAPKADLILYIFLGVFSLSLLGNVLQGWKIRALSSSSQAVLASTEAKVGQSLPELQVTTLDGNTVPLPRSQSTLTVIYVINPDCHWCARNLANIKALAVQSGSRAQFVGLSRPSKDLAEYVARSQLPFPLFVDTTGKVETAVGYVGTPQTVVLSPTGTVLHNWLGAYEGAEKSDIEYFFNAHLPGLLPPS